MHLVSHIVKNRGLLGDDLTRIGMIGTVGASAGADMSAFFTLSDALPRKDTILKTPLEATLPKSIAAQLMLIFSLIAAVEDKKKFEAVFTYVQRMSTEIQAVFGRSIIKSPAKEIALTNQQFTTWVYKNVSVL